MKVCLVSSESQGSKKILAYDNATLKAGIGNINLITVSSMVEKGTKVVNRLPEFKHGAMVKAVLNRLCSDVPNEHICVAVGLGMNKEFGVVAELAYREKKSDAELKDEMTTDLNYMMNQRGQDIDDMYIVTANHKMGDFNPLNPAERVAGAVLAAVIYIE